MILKEMFQLLQIFFLFVCGDYNKNTLFQSNQFRLIVHHSQLKQSCFSIIWAQIHKFRQKSMLGAGFSIKIISSTSTQANSIRRFNLGGGGDLYHVQKNHHAFRHNFQVYFLFVRPGYFF